MRISKPVRMTAGAALVLALLTAIGRPAPAEPANRGSEKLGYNQYIRPILSDNCLYCHGPDKTHRKAKLRLDDRAIAIDRKAIVPGKPEESELVNRIDSDDVEELMPPPETHKTLTKAQKELLKRWITEGAEYEPHWSYIVPKRAVPRPVKNAAWARTPIDAFILNTLEANKIAPSREADKATLLRRLSLDLIGLPPTPQEVQSFVSDTDSNAYEKQVKRLLDSPHFGERMAVPWLDAVRFADTVGFHGDQNQNVFPYRDYVINAFNSNKRFDQFTIEQLAGDLLPKPTVEQRTATCFNRLTMMTREGGAQPKEYLAKYAADRVRTVASAWLGSTMGCCECHDHKFDPFSAKDFYSLGAFWSDLKQWGVYMDYGYTPNPDLRGFSNDSPFPPEITVDNRYLKDRIDRLEARMEELATHYAKGANQESIAIDRFNAWTKEVADLGTHPATGNQPARRLEHLAPSKSTTQPSIADGVITFTGAVGGDDTLQFPLQPGNLAVIRLQAIPSSDKLAGGIHRLPGTKPVAGKKKNSSGQLVQLTASIRHTNGRTSKLLFAFADADFKDDRFSNGHAILGIKAGWQTSSLHEQEAQSALYILDVPQRVVQGDVLVIDLPHNTLAKASIWVSPWAPLNPSDVAGKEDTRPVSSYVLSTDVDPELRAQFRLIQQQIMECRNGHSPVLVTQAVAPAVTRILPRGNWQDESGDVVEPNVPHFLPQPEHAGRRLNRLDLAKWLVSVENPLTARTIMNRTWKQFFGNGLCSIEDLGSQGEWPSHPELLDWLAVEFRESGWDLKHMVYLMVTSAVYRQDSNLRPELKDIDPANRLLASQNPRRLEAEFVRDNALFAAGLLNLDLGGPSVFPYQPDGYYASIQFPSRKYIDSTDDRQYRRGLYMHWQRTFLHPMLANFDAPSREDTACTRNVSNTPQQALTLLNDPSFVEAARVLAIKALEPAKTASGADRQRLIGIFAKVLSREPNTKEWTSLEMFLAAQRDYYRSNPAEASKLIHVGLAPVPPGNDVELAVWTNVCRVILNLHETITRY